MHPGPIRPPATDSDIAQAVDSNGEEAICQPCSEEDLFEDDPVDPKHAMFGDPIISVESTILDEHGQGARDAQPLPTPKGMTPAAWERHRLTTK